MDNKFEFKESTRDVCRRALIAMFDYQKILNHGKNVVDEFMIGYKNKGASPEAFRTAKEKLDNDELEQITKDEFNSLTVYFALVLYKARILALFDPSSEKNFYFLFDLLTRNELIRIYNDKYCELPTRKKDNYIEYMDDCVGMYLLQFDPFVTMGVLPENYFAAWERINKRFEEE